MTICPKQLPSNKMQTISRKLAPLAALLAASLLCGCNYLVLLGYMIGGPPSIEPDFELMTNKSMTDKDVTVAIVCYAPTDVKLSHDNIDNEIARAVTFRLHMHKISVINPDRVRAWLDENPEWDKPEEIGAAFNATYVIYIDVHKFSLFEEGSSDLYRGRSELLLSVIEMEGDDHGEKIYSKEVTSRFPLNVPREAYEISYSNFKQQYLRRLSEEIGRLFYEYYNGDDIVDAI